MPRQKFYETAPPEKNFTSATKVRTRTRVSTAPILLVAAILFAVSSFIITKKFTPQIPKQEISTVQLKNTIILSNQKIIEINTKLQQAKLQDREKVRVMLLAEIKKRKKAMITFIKTNPETANEIALSAELRAQIPSDTQQFVERKVELNGRLEVLHEDDFKADKFRNTYFLVTQKQRFSLYILKISKDLISGAQITVQGVTLENRIAVNKWQILEFPELRKLLKKVKQEKVAVIVARFNDTPSFATYVEERLGEEWVEYLSSVRADDISGSVDKGIFGIDTPENYWSVNKYFKDNSYGRLNISGTKHFIVLPNSKEYYLPEGGGAADLSGNIFQDVVNTADPFIDWSTYDGIIVFLPLNEVYLCDTRGVGTLGSLHYQSDEGDFEAWTVMMPSLASTPFFGHTLSDHRVQIISE